MHHSPVFILFAAPRPATLCPLQGSPPCNPATPFEKGVDPKTFLWTGNILSMEGQRTRNVGTVDFREPIYGYRAPPLLWHFLQGFPPCTRRPLLKKGSIRKLYLRTDNILFMERHRIRNAGAVDFRVPVYGCRSPSHLWVFCALVHGGRHLPKALGFSTMPPACTT